MPSSVRALYLFRAASEKEPIKYKLVLWLAISTGLRRGELTALEWTDIDFERAKVFINKTTMHVPGHGLITTTPKTPNSSRNITIPASVMTLLRQYKTEQAKLRLAFGSRWGGGEKLFTSDRSGLPMYPSNIRAWFCKFLKRHNLPSIRFHDLRHLSATLLIAQGVHAKAISARLGHSNIGVTMDIYGHLLQSADQGAADAMDQVLTKPKEKKKERA
ncbi:site-specific integrase [Brevibacillus formosus]|uniref:site-specific integrase n=1 Tax=Brevibacillus formosus TaxID=54913 RepID=UPI003D21D227